MGERTRHEPGAFSWADVTTTDQEDAKRFYSGLFGWKADDRPVGGDVYYSMMQIDGRSVAAISPQPQQQREAGLPPVWNNYVTVESADDAAAHAKELGGTPLAGPVDIAMGTIGVIRDPQGAVFAIYSGDFDD